MSALPSHLRDVECLVECLFVSISPQESVFNSARGASYLYQINTLVVCFITSLIPPRCFLTPLFSIYQFVDISSPLLNHSLTHSLRGFVHPSLSQRLSLRCPLGSESAFVRMFMHISDKLFGLISESRSAVAMVYLIWCWVGMKICHYFYVIKKDSQGLAFHLYNALNALGL